MKSHVEASYLFLLNGRIVTICWRHTADVAADTEIMDLTEESKEAQEEHARLLKKVETERRARTIAVPTKSEDVAKKLRYYINPFGTRFQVLY